MFPTVILKTFSRQIYRLGGRKKTNKTKQNKTQRQSHFYFVSNPLISNTQTNCQKQLPSFLCASSDLVFLNTSALSTPIISDRNTERKSRETAERQKQRITQTWTPSCTERPVESDVKEALDLGLRALIHHLITSAVCACVCIFTFVYAYRLLFAYVQYFACFCISCVSRQQTDAIICM